VAGDNFGKSVANSGDTVVIGAAGEDSNATGVDGDGADNSVREAGAAFVFDVSSSFTVGGNISGLAGSGLVLQNNAGDGLAISANGSFIFATPLNDGSSYAVNVLTQPTSPNQTCTVFNGSGTLAGSRHTTRQQSFQDCLKLQTRCVTGPEIDRNWWCYEGQMWASKMKLSQGLFTCC